MPPEPPPAPSPALPPPPPTEAPPAPTLATLRIEPAGWVLPLPPGLSLMAAAQQAGVRLARSCRNGTCRACISQVSSGTVWHRLAWPGLSREELAQGWVLPCVAEGRGAVVLIAPAAQRRAAAGQPLSDGPGGPPPTGSLPG